MILGRKKTHILFTHIFDAYVRIQKKVVCTSTYGKRTIPLPLAINRYQFFFSTCIICVPFL